MKFSVKHALVVAIAALCVCVVAGSTIVAVSMGRREAEAATRSLSVSIAGGTNVNLLSVGASTSVPWQPIPVSNFSVPPNSSVAIGTTGGYRVYGFTHLTVYRLGSFWHSIALNNGPFLFGSANVAAVLGIQIQWATASGTNALRIVNLGGGADDMSLVLGIGAWRPLISEAGQDDLSHEITRRDTTGSIVDTITRAQGWHPVVDAVGNTTQIGRPAAVATNFRGWSYRAGGPLLWPVGLPMPVFASKNIYAVNI